VPGEHKHCAVQAGPPTGLQHVAPVCSSCPHPDARQRHLIPPVAMPFCLSTLPCTTMRGFANWRFAAQTTLVRHLCISRACLCAPHASLLLSAADYACYAVANAAAPSTRNRTRIYATPAHHILPRAAMPLCLLLSCPTTTHPHPFTYTFSLLDAGGALAERRDANNLPPGGDYRDSTAAFRRKTAAAITYCATLARVYFSIARLQLRTDFLPAAAAPRVWRLA